MNSRIFVVLVIAMMTSPIYAQSPPVKSEPEVVLSFTLADLSSEADRTAVVSIMTVADGLPDEPSVSREEVFRGYEYQSTCYRGMVMGFIAVDGEPYEWRWSGSEWLRYEALSGSRRYFDPNAPGSYSTSITYIATGTF